MTETVLIRLFVPRPLIERIDRLAAQVRDALGRDVSRAAVVRALIYVYVDRFTAELTNAITADTVKPGRPTERRPA